MKGRTVNECPVCGAKPIHASATDASLGPDMNDDDWNPWYLKVECCEHGWQDRGGGWSRKELLDAGLRP